MMQRGELVPDLLIVALLMPAILRAADDGGYVLDGYPQSVPQAEVNATSPIGWSAKPTW